MFCLGYYDEPQFPDNLFRRALQSPPQGGNYGFDHHAGSQTSLQMQLMGDTKPIQSQPRSQPPLIIQPKPWGHANTDVPGKINIHVVLHFSISQFITDNVTLLYLILII
jgi:hypothetical protein